MTTTVRCDLTELLVGECGCRQHRGGRTLSEEVAAVRADLLGRPEWFAAQYPGTCEQCGTGFGVGAAIRMDVAAGGWRAECCP